MAAAGLPLSDEVCTSLLIACGKAGQLEAAFTLWSELQQQGATQRAESVIAVSLCTVQPRKPPPQLVGPWHAPGCHFSSVCCSSHLLLVPSLCASHWLAAAPQAAHAASCQCCDAPACFCARSCAAAPQTVPAASCQCCAAPACDCTEHALQPPRESLHAPAAC